MRDKGKFTMDALGQVPANTCAYMDMTRSGSRASVCDL